MWSWCRILRPLAPFAGRVKRILVAEVNDGDRTNCHGSRRCYQDRGIDLFEGADELQEQ